MTILAPLQRNREWREKARRRKKERIHCKDITTTLTLPTELEGLNKDEKGHFWGKVPRVQGRAVPGWLRPGRRKKRLG